MRKSHFSEKSSTVPPESPPTRVMDAAPNPLCNATKRIYGENLISPGAIVAGVPQGERIGNHVRRGGVSHVNHYAGQKTQGLPLALPTTR